MLPLEIRTSPNGMSNSNGVAKTQEINDKGQLGKGHFVNPIRPGVPKMLPLEIRTPPNGMINSNGVAKNARN